MSIKAQALVRCSKCGKEHGCDIYRSVNVAQNPELKDEVTSGRLFLWNCPDCGGSNLISYECLYHDPSEKYMIWLLPQGEPQAAQKDAIMNQARAMGDYRLRMVSSAGELIEKIMIFDGGFDDRCIELVKFVAVREQELSSVSGLHFYRIQDDTMVFSAVKDGKMDMMGIGLNVYEDCAAILRRNPPMSAEDGFSHIDQSWVESYMK